MKELHPYVVMLPTSPYEKLKFILTLFSSSIVLEVLNLFEWDTELCQKEIIIKLSHHSNKTVINAIKKLIALGLLSERVRIEERRKRKVKMKCYSLTDIGKWYNVLFKSISELDPNLANKIITDLATIFMSKVLSYASAFSISLSEFLKRIASGSLKGVIRSYKTGVLDLVVLGSIALDVYFKPRARIYAGGSGANVAVAASKLGLKTGFVSKVSADFIGLSLLTNLVDEGVHVGLVEVDEALETPVCTIHELGEPPRISCSYSHDNPPVVQEITQDALNACNNAKAIYLGEGICRIFDELLRKLSNEKLVVYRPHREALEHYLDECLSLLKYSPMLIINSDKERILSKKGLNVPEDLFREGVEQIIVTKGPQGAVLYIKGERAVEIPAPKVKTKDVVGAGDAFSASLIYYLLRGYTLKEAVKNAVILSSFSTMQIGPRKNLGILAKRIGT